MCPRPATSDRRPGFTLVEILVVVVILGIAAAMVVPRIGGTGDQQVAAAARTLLCDLQYAQNEAIVSQQNVTITFDTVSGSYLLSNANGTLQHPVTKKPYQVCYSQTRGFEKVLLAGVSFSGAQTVTFDPLGAPSSGGQVFLTADGRTWRITVASVTGRITVENTN